MRSFLPAASPAVPSPIVLFVESPCLPACLVCSAALSSCRGVGVVPAHVLVGRAFLCGLPYCTFLLHAVEPSFSDYRGVPTSSINVPVWKLSVQKCFCSTVGEGGTGGGVGVRTCKEKRTMNAHVSFARCLWVGRHDTRYHESRHEEQHNGRRGQLLEAYFQSFFYSIEATSLL